MPGTPLVVGTVYSSGSLRKALRLKTGAVDLIELRLDYFARDLEPLRCALDQLPAPCIVTARHPAEGGANQLGLAARRELYEEFLSVASYLDVELRAAGALAGVIKTAKGRGVRVILSEHHFRSTPGLARLREQRRRARRAGADLFKLAALASTPGDLSRLLAFVSDSRELPLSVMGMGAFGKVSRLVLAAAGSRLNYGYLDEPQVPGQWEALLLKQRLQELVS